MSVKGFLDRYFKPEKEKETAKVAPETILEPMVGIQQRSALIEKQKTFHLFTDGACSNNGKHGAKAAYGVHVYANSALDRNSQLYPSESQTNNRAELRAIQAALDLIDQYGMEWSKDYTDFYIWSDSEYSIHCLQKWAKGWASHGWKKKDGGLIQNLDLVKPLYERLQRMPRVSLHHVRGHQDSKRNEFPFDGNHRADQLATQALR